MLTSALHPLQQQLFLQTITINSLHIWQSRGRTYKWYASPAGPMATALTLLLFLWSRQALIRFSFTLLAKHIMWIWSFVPDSPRLTSLSPQAPDASQRSRGGGEEFRCIQRLLWIPYDSSADSDSPASLRWPREPLPNHLPGPGGVQLRTCAHFIGARRASSLYYSRQVPPVGCSARPSLWFNEWEEQTLAWLALHFSSRLNLLTELQMSCQVFL